jgi:phosphoribosylanthranilate isomerase
VQPWGVDVSSGVEIAREGILVKGQKDPEKVRSFMDAIRNVTLP